MHNDKMKTIQKSKAARSFLMRTKGKVAFSTEFIFAQLSSIAPASNQAKGETYIASQSCISETNKKQNQKQNQKPKIKQAPPHLVMVNKILRVESFRCIIYVVKTV
jgi:hypothetical protein